MSDTQLNPYAIPETRAELRRLRQAATPVAYYEADGAIFTDFPTQKLIAYAVNDYGIETGEANAAFLAAAANANGPLLDLVEALDGELDDLRMVLDGVSGETLLQQLIKVITKLSDFRERAESAEAERDRLGMTANRIENSFLPMHLRKLREGAAVILQLAGSGVEYDVERILGICQEIEQELLGPPPMTPGLA